MPERQNVAAFEDKASDDAADHNEGADDLDHGNKYCSNGCTVRRAGAPCIGFSLPYL